MGKDFPDPWIPISSRVDLAILGKLQEELSELQAIVARTIIQGIYEKDPDTGIINKDGIQQEMADVYCMLHLSAAHFNIDYESMIFRKNKKLEHVINWINLIRS